MNLDDFLKRVNQTDMGCWEWIGAIRGNSGYGAIKVKGKTLSAHRYSYEMYVGPITNGLFVCHKCDNKKCVNPDHLFLGTNSDNMKDAYKKGRLKIPDGALKFALNSKPKSRKIKEEQLEEIRTAIKNRGTTTLKKIAETYSLAEHVIKDLSAGRTYNFSEN